MNISVLTIIVILAFVAAEVNEWWEGRKYKKEVQKRLETAVMMERMTGRIADFDYDYYGEVDRRKGD